MSHQENDLTPEELERLSILMEEMGEAIQIIGKIQRHGYASYNPFDSEEVSNRHLLEKELGHVIHAMRFMQSNDDIDWKSMEEAKSKKEKSIKDYLHFAHGSY